MTLHIFNPETDYALAVGEGPYTPPKHVAALRQKFALLPSVYAAPKDIILVTGGFRPEQESNPEFLEAISSKKITIATEENISLFLPEIDSVLPWGWNLNLKRLLTALGVSADLLPSDSSLGKLRDLAHRRTCIPFRKMLADKLDLPFYHCGQELFSLGEVKNFLSVYPYSYFKTPWSSSGRGVVSSTHISEKGLMEWASGSISRQGSVLAEPGYNRKLDFATEWICKDGDPVFLGVSVFKTSPRGKYQSNISAAQPELSQLITEACPGWDNRFIEAQRETLQKMIAPFYSGAVGIDMLCDEESNINPCVEINLRITMGHVQIFRYGKEF